MIGGDPLVVAVSVTVCSPGVLYDVVKMESVPVAGFPSVDQRKLQAEMSPVTLALHVIGSPTRPSGGHTI